MVVEDGRIVHLVETQEDVGKDPRGSVRKHIDGGGLYLIPGLSDIHAHLSLVSEFDLSLGSLRCFDAQRQRNCEEALKAGCAFVRDSGGAYDACSFLQRETKRGSDRAHAEPGLLPCHELRSPGLSRAPGLSVLPADARSLCAPFAKARRTYACARRATPEAKNQLRGHGELLRCHYTFVRPHRALKFGRMCRTAAMLERHLHGAWALSTFGCRRRAYSRDWPIHSHGLNRAADGLVAARAQTGGLINSERRKHPGGVITRRILSTEALLPISSRTHTRVISTRVDRCRTATCGFMTAASYVKAVGRTGGVGRLLEGTWLHTLSVRR